MVNNLDFSKCCDVARPSVTKEIAHCSPMSTSDGKTRNALEHFKLPLRNAESTTEIPYHQPVITSTMSSFSIGSDLFKRFTELLQGLFRKTYSK